MPEEEFARDVAIIVDKRDVNIPFMAGELPGTSPVGETLFDRAAAVVEPPVDPKKARSAVLSNGELAAVLSVVADGTAGVNYTIKPRFKSATDKDFKLDDPTTWTDEVRRQHDLCQILVQAGFRGDGVKSLKAGFRKQEHDRAILGWGGVQVNRGKITDTLGFGKPSHFGSFEACSAKYTKLQKTLVPVPVPVVMQDGRILWIEEMRRFRRIKVTSGGHTWYYKEYGDWRSMDARTGKYSTGNRHKASLSPFQPGTYKPGKLPKGASPAVEIAAWATSFPGSAPYGISGWHSEMMSVAASSENTKLLLEYLKSGLHGVILAAANRPFEDASAQNAIETIDQLGRGRKGLGALIPINLIPGDTSSGSQQNPFANDTTADRGRLILHELSTNLPSQVMDGQLSESLGKRFAHSERIPALLLGKSDSYNFATASAAWSTVNRLRFAPHHEERVHFLSRVLVEMGITFWCISVESPEWNEKEPLGSTASIAGSQGGMSMNQATRLLSEVMDIDIKPAEDWWGEMPLSLVKAVLESPDVYQTLSLLGLDEEAKKYEDSRPIGEAVVEVVSNIDQAAQDRADNT
jgi:capsid portal protein